MHGERFTAGHALVVGVGADLPVTVEDAAAVASLLLDPGRCAYPPEQVRLLTGPAATRDAIRGGLHWLAGRAAAADTALVYFSGHGIEAPDYYLLSHGHRRDDLAATAISGAEFSEDLRGIQARKLVVLLDCCHAGGQARPKELPGSPLPPGVAAGLSQGAGRVVLASSRKDEVSYTGSPYSVFTAALLEALAGAGAFEWDGYARVLDVTLWVARKVPDRTQDRQHPILHVSDLKDNFALAWYAGGAKAPRAPAPVPGGTAAVEAAGPSRAEIEAWRRMLGILRDSLLLIEERMAEYVLQTDVPLQLVKEKRRCVQRIQELEQQLARGRVQASHGP